MQLPILIQETMEVWCGFAMSARARHQRLLKSAMYKRQDELEESLKLTNNRMSSIEMELEGNKKSLKVK